MMHTCLFPNYLLFGNKNEIFSCGTWLSLSLSLFFPLFLYFFLLIKFYSFISKSYEFFWCVCCDCNFFLLVCRYYWFNKWSDVVKAQYTALIVIAFVLAWTRTVLRQHNRDLSSEFEKFEFVIYECEFWILFAFGGDNLFKFRYFRFYEKNSKMVSNEFICSLLPLIPIAFNKRNVSFSFPAASLHVVVAMLFVHLPNERMYIYNKDIDLHIFDRNRRCGCSYDTKII